MNSFRKPVTIYAVIIFTEFLIVGCSWSEEKQNLIKNCSNQFYEQGIYDKKTGEKMTPENNSSYAMYIRHTCISKVNLYLEGYRVNPIIENYDLVLEMDGNIKSYYIQKLKCEADATQCKK